MRENDVIPSVTIALGFVLFSKYNKEPLFRLGARVSSVLILLASLLWMLWPDSWNSIDPSTVPALLAASLVWVGIEITHYILDVEPSEHPSDLRLAAEIEDRFPEQDEYFFRTHNFCGSFEQDYLSKCAYIGRFGYEYRRRFMAQDVQRVFLEFSQSCRDFHRLAARRGGSCRGRDYYIVMPEHEFVSDQLSEESLDRIEKINALGDEIARLRVTLGDVFRENLPSHFKHNAQ